MYVLTSSFDFCVVKVEIVYLEIQDLVENN